MILLGLFIPYDAVPAGHDLVSFNDIVIGPEFPGLYQFQISAFIVTEYGVVKSLPVGGYHSLSTSSHRRFR